VLLRLLMLIAPMLLLLLRLEPTPGRSRGRLLHWGGGEELLRRLSRRSRGCGSLS